jgi:hypothetical protein
LKGEITTWIFDWALIVDPLETKSLTEMVLVREFPEQFDIALIPSPDVVHWVNVSGMVKPSGKFS